MKLTLEQIKTITAGMLDAWEDEKGIHFAKCTPKQVEAWYKVEEILGVRAETTTGVKLDFYTDSKTFSFTVNDHVQEETKYEIYIDNVLCYYYFKDAFLESTTKSIELDGKEHRITLYLPGHGIGILGSVELEDGASFRPHTYDRKMLFIGDSITQGWDSTWDSLSYANHVSRFFNAYSVIQGIGGAKYHDTTFDEAIDFDPDVVIIAYGTNDWTCYATMEEAHAQCKGFLDKLVNRYGDKKLLGITPIWRADKNTDMAMGSFESCVGYVREELIAHGMTVIDGESLIPHLPEFFMDEYLHPNTSGFGVYALNLVEQLQRYI